MLVINLLLILSYCVCLVFISIGEGGRRFIIYSLYILPLFHCCICFSVEGFTLNPTTRKRRVIRSRGVRRIRYQTLYFLSSITFFCSTNKIQTFDWVVDLVEDSVLDLFMITTISMISTRTEKIKVKIIIQMIARMFTFFTLGTAPSSNSIIYRTLVNGAVLGLNIP